MGRPSFRHWLILLSAACMLLLALPLAAGFFGSAHPALDSFAHFRAHLAVLMGIAALPLFVTRFLKVGAVFVLAAILAFATTSGKVPVAGLGMKYGPLYPVDPERPVYRLVQLNLRYNNRTPERVLSMIGQIRPDVVTLEEVSDPWAKKLELLKAAYPYSILCSYPNGFFGVAILSHRPFADGTSPACDRLGALAVATVNFGGTSADIAALHIGWPWPFRQDREIGGLMPYLQRIGQTAVMAGDLNAVPWSQATARIARAGGLTLMPSPGATWMPLGLPEFLRFAGLPIDNVFAKGDVDIHSIRTLEPVGSDHLPVLVEFSMKPKAAEPELKTDLAAVIR